MAIFAALATIPGCSHYGFADAADAAGHNEAGAVVSVWTVATPADEGMDSARLTRALVGALQSRGLAARWTSNAGGASLRCSIVETDVDGFEQALLARVEARCRIGRGDAGGRDIEAVGRHTASIGAGLTAGHAQIQEAASLDALETLADEIVRRRIDER